MDLRGGRGGGEQIGRRGRGLLHGSLKQPPQPSPGLGVKLGCEGADGLQTARVTCSDALPIRFAPPRSAQSRRRAPEGQPPPPRRPFGLLTTPRAARIAPRRQARRLAAGRLEISAPTAPRLLTPPVRSASALVRGARAGESGCGTRGARPSRFSAACVAGSGLYWWRRLYDMGEWANGG